MKYLLLILILLICSLIGYQEKNKYKKQKEFLVYLNNFIEYLYLNIVFYKNNVSEIINNYLIQQNNKNANFTKIFQKKHNINSFNIEILDKYIYNKDMCLTIREFINNLGKSDLIHEQEKINEFKNYLKRCIDEVNLEIKNKGDLYFKVWLGIGLVIDIVLW